MLAATTVLSGFAHRLFGSGAPRRRLRRCDLRRRNHAPVYRAAEVLEERALLSAAFGSALSIGNDIGGAKAFDVATDAAGNSYVTGVFSSTVDFDQGASNAGDTDILTARGSNDAFVAKYAPDNTLAWVRRMGGDTVSTDGSFADGGANIAVDGLGNVYVAGIFSGSADFGSIVLSTSATPGDKDGFVTKLDAGGTFQWANRWGIAGTGDSAAGVGVDAAGNVYALGARLTDAYDVMKFSSTGSSVWSKSIVAHPVFSSDFAVDATGNVFVAGSFQGTVDFDPGSKTYNVSAGGANPSGINGQMTAGFVLKLTNDGKFGWVSPFVGRTVGSTKGYAAAQSVALDGSGNIIVGGSYDNSVDFDPSGKTSTLPTIGGGFVAKLNSRGDLVWSKALESSSSTFVYGLDVDAAGSIYATGNFFGTVDFDPGAGVQSRTTAGGSDLYVLKLTSTGNFSWAETIGDTGNDAAMGIAVDPAGVIHLAGFYQGTVDFDPNPLATYYLTNPGPFNNAFRLSLRQV
ncbi:MAG: hypothetical protein ACT4QC_12090 [Planctomycetaceae bacterium]